MTLYITRVGTLWQMMWSKLLKIGKEKNNGKANIISRFILSQEIVDKYLQFKSYERI